MAVADKFPKLPQKASREEEIQHLQAFLDSCEPGTYLAGIFAGVLTDYVQPQIRDDRMIPIVQCIADLNDERRKAEVALLETTRNLKATEASLESSTECLKLAQQTIERLKGRANEEAEKHSNTALLLSRTTQKLNEAQTKITMLKADLYDALVGARSARDVANALWIYEHRQTTVTAAEEGGR